MSSFDERVAQVDRAVFAKLGGVAVIYAPPIGSTVEVTGLFDANYVLAKGSPDAGVSTLGPAVFLRLEDLPTDPLDPDADPDDLLRLTIRGVVYHVIERRPDDMGGIVLALRRTT